MNVFFNNNFIFRLCLSISDYHPDTWNPAWSVSTILTGLLSFMVSSCLVQTINYLDKNKENLYNIRHTIICFVSRFKLW